MYQFEIPVRERVVVEPDNLGHVLDSNPNLMYDVLEQVANKEIDITSYEGSELCRAVYEHYREGDKNKADEFILNLAHASRSKYDLALEWIVATIGSAPLIICSLRDAASKYMASVTEDFDKDNVNRVKKSLRLEAVAS